MSIKLKQPTMQLATLFFLCVNLMMRWNGHVVFFNSLNKMTNAAYENAMRRCPKKLMINFFLPKCSSLIAPLPGYVNQYYE